MKEAKIYLTVFMLSSLVLTGAGCISFKKSTSGGTGGIYKTFDRGQTWAQKALITTVVPEKPTIGNINVTTISFDPQDNNALYVGSVDKGMFFSYDGGESWMHDKFLSFGRIRSIIVDPKDKCTIFASIGNTIYKSSDCNRTWEKSYVDTKLEQIINSLAVDFYNPSIIYAGTLRGELLRSVDAGKSWSVIKRFKNEIAKVLMDNHDSRVIYVATKIKGLHKTIDGGENWIDLNEKMMEFRDSVAYHDLAIDKTAKNTLIYASKHGLLKTRDGGETWESINLLIPKGERIYSLALNPKNGQEMYFSTRNTLYKTTNSGVDWSAQQMPVERTATDIVVDPGNENIVYMGLWLIEDKKNVLGF